MPRLNKRELATVLAALRYWQHDDMPVDNCPVDEIDAIATGDWQFAALTHKEIDALCERLNAGGGE